MSTTRITVIKHFYQVFIGNRVVHPPIYPFQKTRMFFGDAK